jgi:hypothetical protein
MVMFQQNFNFNVQITFIPHKNPNLIQFSMLILGTKVPQSLFLITRDVNLYNKYHFTHIYQQKVSAVLVKKYKIFHLHRSQNLRRINWIISNYKVHRKKVIFISV